MLRRFINYLLIASAFALTVPVAFAQKYTGSPVTKDRLIRAVRSKQFAVPILVKQIRLSGVDFELTPSVDGELRAARANAQIITAVRENYRYAGVRPATGNAKPPRDTAGEQYESLIYEGLDALGQLGQSSSSADVAEIGREIQQIGNRAVRLNAARPEGYRLVGSGNLLLRNFAEAERYLQQAVDRGGSIAFPVLHLAGNPHLEVVHIGKGFMTVESDQKFFQFNTGESANAQRQQDYAAGIRLATFSIATAKAGRSDVWYFAAATTGMPAEADMIIRLLRNNSMR